MDIYGITATMRNIRWRNSEGLVLPSDEEYSIGIPTLLQNGAADPAGKGRYFFDRLVIEELVKDMLAEDYGCEVEDMDMEFTTYGEPTETT